MNKELSSFIKLAEVFEQNGFKLYLVGGTVRDYLLGIPLTDMDAVTDATPSQMEGFVSSFKTDFTFARFGSIRLTIDDIKFDITTLRKERAYSDSRHPNNIEFVKELDVDVKRRDFSINAMYLDSDLKLIDYVNGEDDLNNHILRMVGDPNVRLQEDPLRILRAFRFVLTYNVEMNEELKTAIRNNISLIEKLNPEKVKQDLKKIKSEDKNKIQNLFNEFGIQYLLNVID